GSEGRVRAVVDGRGNGFDELVGELFEQVGRGRIVEDRADELVAAEAGEHAVFGQQLPDPFGDGREHYVADGVAVDVVDLLEVVEIDHQHRDGPAFAVRVDQEPVDRGGAAASVQAARQRVRFRKLARQRLRTPALGDFALKVRVTPPAENDQGDVEQ